MADEYSKKISVQHRAEAVAERKALIVTTVSLIIVFIAGIYVSLFLQYLLPMIDYRAIFFAVYFVGFMLTVLVFRSLRERYYEKYYRIFMEEETSKETSETRSF